MLEETRPPRSSSRIKGQGEGKCDLSSRSSSSEQDVSSSSPSPLGVSGRKRPSLPEWIRVQPHWTRISRGFYSHPVWHKLRCWGRFTGIVWVTCGTEEARGTIGRRETRKKAVFQTLSGWVGNARTVRESSFYTLPLGRKLLEGLRIASYTLPLGRKLLDGSRITSYTLSLFGQETPKRIEIRLNDHSNDRPFQLGVASAQLVREIVKRTNISCSGNWGGLRPVLLTIPQRHPSRGR